MKITFGKIREMGLQGVVVYRHCGHHVAPIAGLMMSACLISSRALSMLAWQPLSR
ncbi:hypothetical protein [Bradyrhizobium sp. 25ACV]